MQVLRADQGDQPTVPPTQPIALLLRIAAADDDLDHAGFLAALLDWIARHGPAYDLLGTQEVALCGAPRMVGPGAGLAAAAARQRDGDER